MSAESVLPPLSGKNRRGRFTHVIRPNDRVSIPRERCFLDTEATRTRIDADTERQTLSFGWCCFERVRDDSEGKAITSEWHRFTTAADWWDKAEQKLHGKCTLYVYCHNLGYDAAMLSLATEVKARGFTVEEYVSANHLMWVRVARGGQRLCFVDTLNYFSTSLAKLGDSIGAPKLKMPRKRAPQAEWDAYCRNDVEVLRTAMHAYYELVQTEELGACRKTAASQAFGAWRHRFMQHKVLIVLDERLSELERSAYHGGRSEVFYDRAMRRAIHCLDINSMYASVMLAEGYPAVKLAASWKESTETLADLLDEGCVIADVDVTTDEPVYPHHTGERVVYPTGSFRTTLSTPELRYAVERGHVTQVHRWVLYQRAPLFRSYVETLYNLRLRYRALGNEAFAYLLKLLLNSLYGKFGQHGYHWVPCGADPIPTHVDWWGNCEEGGPALRHRTRFGTLWHQLKEAEAFESFPAIAAHVAAEARMKLWRLILVAGREHVYYVDTDSLYVDNIGLERLQPYINASELGMLKVEKSSRYVHFRVAKDYQIGRAEYIKGIRKDAEELSEGKYRQWQFESYDAVLARGCDGEIMVTRITKVLSRANKQSLPTSTGWRKPLSLTPTGTACGAPLR